MKVFKFGGASVKDAKAIQNAVTITDSYEGPIVVVVSAIGKTTNELENLWSAFVNKDKKATSESFKKIVDFHQKLINELFQDRFEATHLFEKTVSQRNSKRGVQTDNNF